MNWTLKNIPDLKNKVAIITGANSGLGYETALALAVKNCTVVLAVRNLEKGQAALERIKEKYLQADLRLYKMDLTDLSSIKDFSTLIKKNFKAIDLLINNAGVMNVPYKKTVDGFETHFGGNHLGHFALTGFLIDVINPEGRVVTVSSFLASTGVMNFDDLNMEKSYNKYAAYAQSKLANLMFSLELARKLKQGNKKILSLAAHPGYARTNLLTSGENHMPFYMLIGNAIFAQSAETGALPILRAATGESTENGEFYGPSFLGMRGAPIKIDPFLQALDLVAAKRLWTVSEEMTGVRYL